MSFIKNVVNKIMPPPDKAPDGRDQWPSRTAFILASLSGVIGMGNFLRYPSTVFNNYGLQWFVPYFLALCLLAIPALTLELAAGNAYRGGTVTAFNKISRRLRGTGVAMNYVGLIVSIYFIPIIAWGMVFFQLSFQSPLPWAGKDSQEFFMNEVVNAVPRDTSGSWVDYPGTALDGRLVGWNAFLFFCVWLCIFKGTGWTGRVVYFTMGLPIIVIIILIGRGASLPNAGRGIKLYFATWRSEALSQTQLWQDAVGQVFYSTGVGFGYFTAYASYNFQYANAAQDSVIIVFTNAFLEASLAFAAFGIVGFLGMTPDNQEEKMGSYSLGFMTYPQAFNEMPGANFWSVLFFFTLGVVGISSTFVMLDAAMTQIMDSSIAQRKKWRRSYVATVLVIVVFLLAMPNMTRFGYFYLEGIDQWINNVGLVFVVWAECVGATTIYRFEDVLDQVGVVGFALYNTAYLGGTFLGLVIGHTVSPGIGAAAGFGFYAVATVAALVMSKTPDVPVKAKAFGKNIWSNAWLAKFYYLAFYSGDQLTRDLNAIIAGKGWKLPFFWAPLLRYFTSPILSIILSLAYPAFEPLTNDPLHVMGFIVGHMVFVFAILGFCMPRWLDVFIIPERRNDWKQPTAPGMIRDIDEGQEADGMEAGSSTSPSMAEKKKSGDESAVGDTFRGDGVGVGEGSLPGHNSEPTTTVDGPRRD